MHLQVAGTEAGAGWHVVPASAARLSPHLLQQECLQLVQGCAQMALALASLVHTEVEDSRPNQP